MNRPELKYKKIKIIKEVRFEPYEEDEIIVVPDNRHKLTVEQIKVARERWAKTMTDFTPEELARYKAMVDKVNRSTDADIAKCGQTDLPSQLHKEIWNRAIERAASEVVSLNEAKRIRKLKV